MSQTLRFVVLLFCLSAFTLPGMAQARWKLIATDPDEIPFYVDENFISKPNGNILGWQKSFFPLNDTHPLETYYIVKTEWNCRDNAARQLQIFVYDRSGRFIKNIEPLTNWRTNPPGSIGDVTLDYVCRSSENKNEFSQRPSSGIFAQVTKNTKLMSQAIPNSEIIRKVAVGEKLTLVSEESEGKWYRVLDPKTGTEGWLNGYHFKIVKAVKSPAKRGPAQKRRN